jgi:predicted 2-oxoglutarate/Fe(II)-dependent dioxygenase YbiX
MIHSINKFFDKTECADIIEFCMNNGEPFSYNPNETWDCRRIYDNEFKEKILNKFKSLFNSGDFKLWFNLNDFNIKDVNISLTKYYDGRWLGLHLDKTSQLTTVIVLSENFEDGRFILSENKMKKKLIKLNIGESISFDGGKIFHGVEPVHTGIRCALNIWMTDTNHKFTNIKNNRSLI